MNADGLRRSKDCSDASHQAVSDPCVLIRRGHRRSPSACSEKKTRTRADWCRAVRCAETYVASGDCALAQPGTLAAVRPIAAEPTAAAEAEAPRTGTGGTETGGTETGGTGIGGAGTGGTETGGTSTGRMGLTSGTEQVETRPADTATNADASAAHSGGHSRCGGFVVLTAAVLWAVRWQN